MPSPDTSEFNPTAPGDGSRQPTERLQRLRAVEMGERREADIFEDALREFLGSSEFAPPSSDLPSIEASLKREKDQVFETVESDRAAFRKSVVEEDEAQRRMWETRRRLIRPTSGIIILVVLGVAGTRLLPVFPYLNTPLASLLTLVIGITVTDIGTMFRKYTAARDASHRAGRDCLAAETLLFHALVNIGLPDQLRQIRHGAQVSAPTPPTQTINSSPAVNGKDRITPFDSEHLVEVYEEAQQIPTGARKILEKLTRNLRGASLGIAGPRGAGKTTLVRWFFARQISEFDHLALQVAAPVRYEPRDFVLTLFAALCEEAMGPEKAPLLPRRHLNWNSPWTTVLGGLLIGAGALVFAIDLHTPHIVESSRGRVGVGLIAVGVLVLIARYLRSLRPTEGLNSLGRLSIRNQKTADTAPQLLSDIRFQLTYTSGYSGKLTTSFGELATDSSYSLAAKQESFPEIVIRFQSFLEKLAKERGRVYIGIDELDKLKVEDAVRFLDDVKGLFGVSGCFFLVSISEDALGQFERRGLPMRDTFDSTFDEVIRVKPLEASESLNLLGRRAEGIDPSLGSLCHILAGGIPRDVIRHARHLAAIADGHPTLLEAADALVGRDLHERANGTKLALSTAVSDPAVDDWLDKFDDATFEMLFDLADCEQTSDLPTGNGSAPSTRPDTTSSLTSTRHLACLAYVGDTALALLRQENENGRSPLREESDSLGLARLRISNSPRRAKALCDEIRERHKLPLISSDFAPIQSPDHADERPLRRLLRGEMPL